VPACAHYICTQAGQLTSTDYIDNIVAKQRDGQSQRVLSVSLPLLARLVSSPLSTLLRRLIIRSATPGCCALGQTLKPLSGCTEPLVAVLIVRRPRSDVRVLAAGVPG